MNPLSDHDVLRIWETGQNQHPLDRALTMLRAASAEVTRKELAKLTIGQRDRRLFDLFEANFGPTLRSCAVCPRCNQRVEFTMSAIDLKLEPPVDSDCEKDLHELTTGSTRIRFRLPDSTDLAATTTCEPGARRQVVALRCIVDVAVGGKTVSVRRLTSRIMDKLSEQMARSDPQADILVGLDCPACSYRWELAFDIATFLWNEISICARRLLKHVHILAAAYKWREADILAMSTTRRRFYLDEVDV